MVLASYSLNVLHPGHLLGDATSWTHHSPLQLDVEQGGSSPQVDEAKSPSPPTSPVWPGIEQNGGIVGENMLPSQACPELQTQVY